ncbi:MAG: four helix bundle protein [Gemmatimonadales bacterium]
MTITPPSACKRYQGLKAWIACHELFLDVHRRTASWPVAERYELANQARRAAFSAAANIVEGCSRNTAKQFRHFLAVSLGSLAELSYALLAARDIGLFSTASYGEVEALRDHANQLTWGLYRAVSQRAGKSKVGPKPA